MPLLGRKNTAEMDMPESMMKPSGQLGNTLTEARRLAGLFPVCGNPGCSTGRIHLWRSRQVPIFEGEWTCSETCTRDRVRSALAREMEGRDRAPVRHQHRMPLGLILYSQGRITQEQLRTALEAQREAGSGKFGEWLLRLNMVKEHHVTQALSVQWNCPVLNVENHFPVQMASLVPRLLLDAFGILPVKVVGSKVFYVGFEDHIDPCITLALERMTGLRVEAGLVDSSVFRRVHPRMLNEIFPQVRILETADEEILAKVLSQLLEREKPVEARLVRIHECLWLRLWRRMATSLVPERDQVFDVLCPLKRME